MSRAMRRDFGRHNRGSRRHGKSRRADIRFTRDSRPKDSPADPLSRWPAFVAAVRARLDIGQREYGDRSFSRSVEELTKEIEEELLDVTAWSYILWTQIHFGTAAETSRCSRRWRRQQKRGPGHKARTPRPPRGSHAHRR
jgi:hypothetical protein